MGVEITAHVRFWCYSSRVDSHTALQQSTPDE